MRIIADFHFHSRFSRACSKDLTILNLEKTAAFKGVHILGTGDFTHPQWFAEIKEMLEPAESGLYRVKRLKTLTTSSHPSSESPPLGQEGSLVRFVLSGEISSIYKQGGKTRRVHTVFVMPSIESAGKFREALIKRKANLSSDGRPIVGISAEDLAKIAFDIDEKTMVIPAHIWTPWFAMFGSMSGFDSVEECFGSVADKIFAIEMGMSSDAAMNWRVKNLDRMSLLASSDAHSLRRIAREGDVFKLPSCGELSYDWVYNVIKKKDPKSFLFTIKYFPQEGRYHYDGHDKCNFSCKPQETKKLKDVCPKCGRGLTVGVLSRAEELADRPEGYEPNNAIPTRHLVPLEEVIANALGKGVQTKTVVSAYEDLVTKAGGEYQAMLDLSYDELGKLTQSIIVEGIKRNREENLHIEPGFDGRYGKIEIFTDEERKVYLGKKNQALF
ncbi:MAG: DNA helicase UvrD [Candidatus Doudnabacteria bacterium CG10_big_fil_rev_8_21_14_0_10_41_10]|uniref:DNA helicase UvrD n=1 Tax=Candidatus Doudnabacteria bacterium CG10_big_fil_rev_8_21_14_0_10_41_10 TaxID=1974551 RepID=A0A2H0VF94_9BACT|nr:MAG: DNA helicase UvrD [Candidatus Doudnabacteria bacterium CG10_big_fil_rev_8_21_14_0_10_41_10]